MHQRILLLLILIGCQRIFPQTSEGGAMVMFDGRPLIRLYVPLGRLSPQDRAMLAERRLRDVSSDRTISVDAIRAKELPDATEIYAGSSFLFAVTDDDAKAAGRSRADLVGDYQRRTRLAILEFRENRTWQSLIRGTLYAAGATLVWIGLMIGLTRAARKIRSVIFERRRQSRGSVLWHRAELLSASRSAAALLTIASIIRWTLVLIFFEIYLTLVLSFFPGTAGYAEQIGGWVWDPVRFLLTSLVEFLPNLFFIAAICVATYGLIRLSDFVFKEIGEGRILIDGFYTDWAVPTSRLFRVLILVLGAVVVFPYLPGSKSPAFQGISIFLGVLLSLGSTSAVASVVSGTILTYMRPFQLGDRVKISDIVGDVVEKNLLVTRIQTIKNEIITIPNANILSGQIWNYSTSARQNNLILHTTVTIGYDAPWRTVHQLLISAAQATRGIQQEPKPFILQTALNDFYVSYELNAYTAEASQMVMIYSDLHQNIQDRFNEAGVEIMSPHYAQLRDGNTVTIPESYRGADYQAPGLRVEPIASMRAAAGHS